ncbi:GPI anchored serine-threonine rich family protein (plasmid) [Streptomyces sp. BI20]|uniref:GPI anchored serine-threonine rich family protein n=1 Tax=Streptomyces sp. BI20 TaxID=3403460 RepID=UPI003C78CB28
MAENTPPTTGVGASVRRVAGRLNSALSRPAAAVLLGADSLIVSRPEEGARWRAGEPQTVTWCLIGPMPPVDVHLVRREGISTVVRAVLAEGVAAPDSRCAVTVPADVEPGEYLVNVTSAEGMLDAFSRPFRVEAADESAGPVGSGA